MAKSKGIKIQQFDMNNMLINSFISINEASRETGISNSTISKALRLNTFIAGNYIWKK